MIAVGPAVRADALGWAPDTFFVSRESLVGLAMFLLVLTWFGWRAAFTRRSAIARAQGDSMVRLVRAPRVRALGGAAAVVVIVAVSMLVGSLVASPLADDQPRDVARSAIDPRLTIATSVSPLASYRSYFEDDAFNAVLFSVDVTAGEPDRVRLATLSHFDGETFSASAGPDEAPVRFQRVPSTVEAGEGTVEVAADVTIGAGGGIWVPLLGELGSVTFHGARQSQLVDGFYYLQDDVAGVSGAEGGIVSGDRYSIKGNVPAEPRELADLGTPPGATTIDSDLIPGSVTDWVAMQALSHDGSGLAELINRLRNRGYLSHALDHPLDGAVPEWQASLGGYAFAPAHAGHSYDRIDRLFVELLERQASTGSANNASLVAAVGDDEQFAAAAAMIAAELGFPSRVVVGARLAQTDPDGWTPAPCEAGECRGENLTAWVEVQAADGEWIAADVSPQFEVPLAPETATQRDPEFATALDPQRAEPIVPPASQRGATSDTETVEEDEVDETSLVWTIIRITGISLLALLVLIGPLLAIVAWKALRRRRRRNAADPSESIYGGWDEYLDTAVESGREPLPLATRKEVAQEYASPSGAQIALLTDRATFSGVSLAPDEAARMWDMVAADRKAWLAQKTLWARLRMRLSLRSTWHSVMAATPAPPQTRTEQRPQWRSEHTGRTSARAGRTGARAGRTGARRSRTRSHKSRRRSRRTRG